MKSAVRILAWRVGLSDLCQSWIVTVPIHQFYCRNSEILTLAAASKAGPSNGRSIKNHSYYGGLVKLYQLLTCCVCLVGALTARAEITIYNQNNWRFSTSGFVETDFMSDSTRSFREIIGNAPVVQGTGTKASNGVNGRTQFSMRNSRLAFAIQAPKFGDWAPKAYFEFDFLGYNPDPGSSNSEGALYASPTLRVRHAYLQAQSANCSLLAGQTWEVLGFQPYYFLATADVSPIPGQLYNRTVQLRVQHAYHFGSKNKLQTAIALLRPPEAESELPDLQLGARFVVGSRLSGFTGGSTGARAAQPMSFAVSGAVRRFTAPSAGGASTVENKFIGDAFAFDALVPILATHNKSHVGGTLTLAGEFSTGSGYGDQLPKWTGNLANPISTASSNPTKTILGSHPLDLDGGIGDYNATTQNFELVQLQTFNVQLQYHLYSPYWVGLGYSQIVSPNMSDFTSGGLTDSGSTGYDRDRAMFVNLFHNFTPQLRGAIEYAYADTHYVDGSHNANNRYQASVWFIF